MSFLGLIFVALFATWFYIRTRKPKNFPPGPPRLPMVGSLPFMRGSGRSSSLLLGVSDQIKKHGPIIGFYYGNSPAVFLTEYSSIKEAFKSNLLSARPDFRPYHENQPGYEEVNPQLNEKVQGVLFSHGTHWKEMRRFLLRNLRDFGFGKTSMEEQFKDEVAKLSETLAKNGSVPIDLYGTMNISVINALWSIVTGEKFEVDDEKLLKIVRELNSFAKNTTVMPPVTAILPFYQMAKWPIISKYTGHNITKAALASIGEMISSYIKEHTQTLDPEVMRDFLDVLILEQKKSTNPSSCFTGIVGKKAILNSLIDLFMAGMETTTTALMIIILQLLHHPNVQDLVHEEIDRVCGHARTPSLEDLNEMPYTNAVLQESLRIGALVHFAIPHSTSDEFKIGSYTLPKGTIVISSLYHSMHDPKLFSDPEVFKPERFIDENGKFIRDERVIPFSVGKRYCLGQSLAEKQFFIFFTGLLQRFQINQAPGTILPSYVDIYPGTEVLIRSPPHYKVILTKRSC